MNDIQELIKSAEGLDESHLYAGLTVMCREMTLSGQSPECPALNAMKAGFDVDKEYWKQNSPLWDPQSLPKFDFQAASFSQLQGDILHEWTHLPGQRLLQSFAKEFRKTLCKGKDSLHYKLNHGLLNQADLPATIVATILASGMATGAVWVPILVYVALLISKTGLNVYCKAK
jgi:hypothetical protein